MFQILQWLGREVRSDFRRGQRDSRGSGIYCGFSMAKRFASPTCPMAASRPRRLQRRLLRAQQFDLEVYFMAFDDDFAMLTGNLPFPWQRRLFHRFVACDFPSTCDLPTGLGKTSTIAIWLLALSENPKLPRRLVYVVNRRTVVDQSTAEAEHLLAALRRPAATRIRDALSALAAVQTEAPVAISTLRGEFADNGAWRRDPARPAIIVGTVDMVGSRLLFSGYGLGFRSRPLHAGFLGHDSLVIHDEAHLEPAFQSLLSAIADEQKRAHEPRPLKVLSLSATTNADPDFTLAEDDLRNPVVRARLHARKRLWIHDVQDRKELVDHVVERAASLSGKVVVFLSSVEHVEKCAAALRKVSKQGVVTLTGTMRGAERDELVSNPVFARFLPRPDAALDLRDGTVFLVATAAGEVGIDLSADHLVTDLPPFDALAQRLGRVNRYGNGDAEVHVYAETIKQPPNVIAGPDEPDEDVPRSRKDEFDHARFFTRQLLSELPALDDGARDASPAALRSLAREGRVEASTPKPDVRHVDGMLFDRWSYTTILEPLPGRPPVAEWLHGVAEWEAPRTIVAWRREVTWLEEELLAPDCLADFLSDYPLRSRETLSDVTSRVLKHLQRLAHRDEAGFHRAWLVRPDCPPRIMKLGDLVSNYDSKKNPFLDGATVVLPPELGGLSGGLLDGNAVYASDVPYDLGSQGADRLVHEAEEDAVPPEGMRLVRVVSRKSDGEGARLWWRLYAASPRADDDGSRNSRKELLLDVHLERTEAWATRISERLGLSPIERSALARAGRAHDLGKQRRVWQRAIKRFKDPPLAKGPMQPSELGHYRHELGSLHDGDFNGLSEEAKDLAIHAVAAHHGRARPYFAERECFDPEVRDEVVAALVREVPLRFDRVQRRYGRWGLAWLESILRAADVLGSDETEVRE